MLVELDDAELQSQLLQLEADYQAAQADLSNAKAALNNALVSLRVNKGDIDINQVKLEKAQKIIPAIKTSLPNRPLPKNNWTTLVMIMKHCQKNSTIATMTWPVPKAVSAYYKLPYKRQLLILR